jgi:transmembrane sensor
MRSTGTSRIAISKEAADWFVENRGESLDRMERVAFIAWLKTSPVHVEEYLALASLARDLAKATNDPRLDVELMLEQASGEPENVMPLSPVLPRQERARGPMQRSHYGRRFAAAVALLLIFATAIWFARDGERFALPRTFSTARGELRAVKLPDGTLLRLNSDSEVTVRYSRAERLVSLNRGQALFEVEHEDSRQFRLESGPRGVVAVGTEFDVYRKSSGVVVTVVEGAVIVYAGSPPLAAAHGPATHYVRLDAGYQIEVSEGVGKPKRVDARAAIAWLKRQIAFDNEPLGDVAAEFNRYGPITLEIEDARVRALPISGVFDAYDTDSFAAFLQTLNGVVLQKSPGRIRVRGIPSADRDR